MTGRKEFLWRGWGPLEPFDKPVALEARKAGAVASIVTDHYHYWENNAHGYLEHFNAVKLIRGHEGDMWNTEPLTEIPKWAAAIENHRGPGGRTYYNNVKDFRTEEDFFSPKTLSEASDWLEKNHMHEKFFLWTECFDVHEPFHVPEPYRSMYTNLNGDEYSVWPPYQNGYHGYNKEYWENVSQDELDYVRAQYYGKLTMTDKWLGKLLDKLDEHNLWDNTAVIITTDHGHELGEKQRYGKQPPHYDLSANIPLMIWHPSLSSSCHSQPMRVDALTSAVDIYPTLLEILGADASNSVHGRSLMPLIRRETETHRDAVIYGQFGSGVTVTNKEYTYHSSWDEDGEINVYTSFMIHPQPLATGAKYIPGVDCPVWKIPVRSSAVIPELLFDRITDPAQENDVSALNRGTVGQMRAVLKRVMDEEGAPPEQYARLGFEAV